MIAAQILAVMSDAATYERAVRATMLDAIACARADGAPISENAESEARIYFARQRRMRATLAVCVWLAGGA